MTRRRTGPCTATRHDTALAYQVDKCRCPTAREAYRLYRKRLREHRHQPLRVDATGTARRLQALAAIGWPTSDLAQRTGHSSIALQQWRSGRHRRVHRATHQIITSLYEQLWDTAGPSTYSRRHATRHGWAVPMAWSDDTIDDPNGRPDLGRRPRGRIDLADITHLERFGHTRTQIAARLGVDPESITTALRRKAS